MCGSALCVAVALLGIDAGWRPLPEGGVQYLIQIEPHVLESLRDGRAIESHVPPFVRDVRSYKVTAGTGALPHELPPEAGPTGSATGDESRPPASSDPGAQTDPSPQPELTGPELPSGVSPTGLTTDSPPERARPSQEPGAAEAAAASPQGQPEAGSPPMPESFQPDPAANPVWSRVEPPVPAVDTSPADLPAVPNRLPPNPDTRPIGVKQASHEATQGSPSDGGSPGASGRDAAAGSQEGEPKPWLPLTVTLLALFGSLGTNVFLLWISVDFRRRYRALLGRIGGPAAD